MKGFIGPIGDDIPSIFPIIAGVMLFIATVFYANNEAAQRDSGLNLRKAALELSYVATEKGYVDASFAGLCESSLKPTAAKSGVYFAVMLNDCTKIGLVDPFSGQVICSSGGIDGPAIRALSEKKRMAVFTYPVAADCATGGGVRTGLGNLEVFTWYD